MIVDSESEARAGRDWSEAEVRLIVADYFDMLESELLRINDPQTRSRLEELSEASGDEDKAFLECREISH